MKTQDKINEVLRDLSALLGPDRDLDLKLALFFGGFSVSEESFGKFYYFDDKRSGLRFAVEPGGIPRYTADLKDAINFVNFVAPGACFYRISNCENGIVGGHASVIISDSPVSSICEYKAACSSLPDKIIPGEIALLRAFFIALQSIPVDAEKPPEP